MLTAYQISGDSRAGDEGGENALKQFLIQPSEDPCPPRWFRLRLKLLIGLDGAAVSSSRSSRHFRNARRSPCPIDPRFPPCGT